MRHERFDAPSGTVTQRLAGRAAWLGRFTAIFLLVSILAHRFLRIETPDFFWLLAIAALSALLVLMIAVAAMRRAWQRGEPGSGRAARAVILALIVLAPYAAAGWAVLHFPPLHDMATDPLDPPEFLVLRHVRTARMNPLDRITLEEARIQAEFYPAITGRRYAAAPDLVLQALHGVLKARGWEIRDERGVGDPPLEKTIEASGRSAVFGFPFDVAIRVTDEEETSYVDLRSSMRFGEHDLGFNARRMIEFMIALDAEMDSRAGGPDVDAVETAE